MFICHLITYNVCNCKYDTSNISNSSFNFYVPFKAHWSYGVPFVNTYECRCTETDQFHRCQIGYVFAVM